jgi:hypothetical protein
VDELANVGLTQHHLETGRGDNQLRGRKPRQVSRKIASSFRMNTSLIISIQVVDFSSGKAIIDVLSDLTPVTFVPTMDLSSWSRPRGNGSGLSAPRPHRFKPRGLDEFFKGADNIEKSNRTFL